MFGKRSVDMGWDMGRDGNDGRDRSDLLFERKDENVETLRAEIPEEAAGKVRPGRIGRDGRDDQPTHESAEARNKDVCKQERQKAAICDNLIPSNNSRHVLHRPTEPSEKTPLDHVLEVGSGVIH